MKASVRKFDLGREFHTSEDCYIIEMLNTPDDPDASIARARVAPGVTTRWHRLAGTVERYVILEGRGVVSVGDLPETEVGPGDVVLIPPMCRQRIRNTGPEDLVFLAICTPRFTADVYEDMECRPDESEPLG